MEVRGLEGNGCGGRGGTYQTGSTEQEGKVGEGGGLGFRMRWGGRWVVTCVREGGLACGEILGPFLGLPIPIHIHRNPQPNTPKLLSSQPYSRSILHTQYPYSYSTTPMSLATNPASSYMHRGTHASSWAWFRQVGHPQQRVEHVLKKWQAESSTLLHESSNSEPETI